METTSEPAQTKAQAREDGPSEVDRAVAIAADRADDFARLPPLRKAEMLERLTRDLASVSADIVALGCEAKGIQRGTPPEAEEWFAGPSVAVALAGHHAAALRAIAKKGRPDMPGVRVGPGPQGRVVTHLPPLFTGGGLLEAGLSFRVLHTEGTRREDVLAGQQPNLHDAPPGTTAVLGAGNVASIPIADVIHALFVENRTAVLKMNPVNAYLRAPFERAFAPLLEAGYVQIVDGGAEVGTHLVGHARISHIHLTGSAETHDRIVWGPPGPEQAERKAKNEPVLQKPVTSELGNISPALVTPYLYSKSELRGLAENLATQITNNASFNCNAGKMLVLPKGFPQRKILLDTLSSLLAKVPPRKAYYPGARERHQKLSGWRETINIGKPDEGALPWSLVLDIVDPKNAKDPLFTTEPFCSMLSVVEVGSLDPVEFLDQAVTFCNERLWGTLSACIFAPPLFEDDGAVEHALERATFRLEYGAVGVNVWPAVVYATPRAPWGGHPKATLKDVQSGIGFVHNPLFLPRIEKVIVKGPLVPIPRQPFTVGHAHGIAAAKSLVAYAEAPGLGAALGVVKSTLFG